MQLPRSSKEDREKERRQHSEEKRSGEIGGGAGEN
jgi:hypothetical protein